MGASPPAAAARPPCRWPLSSRPMRAAAQECSRDVQRVLRAEQELPAKKLKALWTHKREREKHYIMPANKAD
jgi:hypothetical protein